MKTIVTKYIGPTNFKGSRVKASDGDNSITLSWDSAANSDCNHMTAARTLAAKLEWHGTMQGGNTKTGMVFVFIDKSAQFTI